VPTIGFIVFKLHQKGYLMSYRTPIIPSLILTVFLFSQPAFAQIELPDVQTVTAWGEASVTDDMVADKETAIASARREALEKVVGAYVTSTTRVRNFEVVEDRIYSRSTGFINSVVVLQEERNQIQRVQIQAQVSLVPVTEILRASGLLRKWRTGVILNPDSQQLGQMLNFYSQSGLLDVTRNIEAQMGKALIEAGFKVVDPRHLQQLRKKLANTDNIAGAAFSGMDLLITGSVSLSSRATFGSTRQAICQIHGKILRADTGEIVYQGNIGNTFDGTGLIVDRGVAVKFATTLGNGFLSDGTPDLRTFGGGDTAALDKAIRLTSSMFADIMISQITRIPAAANAQIMLVIYGIEFLRVMELEEQLKNMAGVSNITVEEFSGDSQNIAVAYDGDAMMLARSLSKLNLFKELGLTIKNVTQNKIVIK